MQFVFLLSIGRSRWQECSCLTATHIYLHVLLVTLFNLPFFRRHELHKYFFATIVQKNIVCHIFNRQVFPSCCTCITVISVFWISNHWHTRIKRVGAHKITGVVTLIFKLSVQIVSTLIARRHLWSFIELQCPDRSCAEWSNYTRNLFHCLNCPGDNCSNCIPKIKLTTVSRLMITN